MKLFPIIILFFTIILATLLSQNTSYSKSLTFDRSETISFLYNFTDDKLLIHANAYFSILESILGDRVDTIENSNLVIFEHNNLIKNGELQNNTLLKLGFPDDLLQKMSKPNFWKSGCGTFYFFNHDKQILNSISLIDGSLSFKKKKLCLYQALSNGLGFFPEGTIGNPDMITPALFIFALATKACHAKSNFNECIKNEADKVISNIQILFGNRN